MAGLTTGKSLFGVFLLSLLVVSFWLNLTSRKDVIVRFDEYVVVDTEGVGASDGEELFDGEEEEESSAGGSSSAVMGNKKQPDGKTYYTAIGAIFKQEHKYIVEWIEYHILLGVDHFYLATNDCGDEAVEAANLIEPFVTSGRVTLVTDFKCAPRGFQSEANTALVKLADSTWLFSIDVDEFIVIPDARATVSSVLRRFEGYDAVALLWRVFGSSGHVSSPAGSVVVNYQWYADPHTALDTRTRSFKSVVRTARCHSVKAHECTKYVCTEEGKNKVAQPMGPNESCGCAVTPDVAACMTLERVYSYLNEHKLEHPAYDTIWLNHYRTKSDEDWEQHKIRGRPSVPDSDRNAFNKHGPPPPEYNVVFDSTASENLGMRLDLQQKEKERSRLRNIFSGVGPVKQQDADE